MQLRRLHKVANDLETELRAKIDSRPTWNVWLGIQKLIAEIEGNFAPEQFEVTKRDDLEGWTLEELEHYIKTYEEPEWYRKGQSPPTDDRTFWPDGGGRSKN